MRLHLNENTAGCSPAVLRRAPPARAIAMPGSIRTTTRRRRRSPAHFGVPVDHLRAHERPRRGDSRRARPPRAATTRRGVPEAVGVAPGVRQVRDLHDGASAAGWSRCRSTTSFELSAEDIRAAVTPRTRIVFLTNPHNPSGRVGSARHAARAREGRGAGDPLRRRGVRGLLRRDADRSGDVRRRFPNLVVGRTFSKAYGLAGLRVGALVGAPATLAPLRAGRPALQRERVGGGGAAASRSTDRDYRDWYLEQAAASRTLLDRCVRAARPRDLAERRQLRAGARRRRRRAWCAGWRRAACASAIVRTIRAAGSASASRPASSRTRAARSRRSRRCCAPRGNRPDDARDVDPAEARHRGARPLRRVDRHPLLRSHAGAGRAARRVRPDAEGGRRSRRRSAPHRRGRRHRARRSGRSARSARGAASIAPATSSCRWTRRWRSRRSISAAARTRSSICG